MKIIVDAMGGDNAPLEIVRGALDANRNHGVEIILVGRTAEVLKAVEACGQKSLPAGVEIKAAKEVVELAGGPALAFKQKPDSAHDDRFSGAGLSRNHIESRSEFHIRLVNKRKVLQTHPFQHVFPYPV